MNSSNFTSDNQAPGTENPSTENTEQTAEQPVDDGEFKLTVRKLELPVRPRGVLADG
jgi:hypothetical protein